MTENHGIQQGQIWKRNSTGREVQVMSVRNNYVQIDDGRAITYPWTKSFLKAYTKGTP